MKEKRSKNNVKHENEQTQKVAQQRGHPYA
jgi:hypothetical protein